MTRCAPQCLDGRPLGVVSWQGGGLAGRSAGDVMVLPPGHDAWSLGDTARVFVEFSRGNDYYAD